MKVKFGSIITDGVNKIGGHVIQSNAYGRFQRTLVTPYNPQTASQSLVRTNFLAVKQEWSLLNDTQRAAWIAAVGEFPRQNQFGDTYYPTGSNLFTWLNVNRVTLGLAVLSTPPTAAIPNNALTLTLNAAVFGPKVVVNIAPSAPTTDDSIMIYSTDSLSPGINYVSSKFRLIAIIPGNTTGNYTLTVDYLLKFSAPVLDKKIFVKCICVKQSSGQQGIIYKASTIVTAT